MANRGLLGRRAFGRDPYFDPGSTPQAGKVFFYSAAGGSLPTTPTWSYAGTQSYENVGWGVADGGLCGWKSGAASLYGNLLLGAPGYGSGTRVGAAFAFYPDSSGNYASSPDWMVTGGVNGANLGASLCNSGKITYSEPAHSVIVGAPYYNYGSGSQNGQVLLYVATSSGFSTTPSWSAYGSYNYAYFGFSVAAGHLAGKVYYDLIVGAPGANGEQGGTVYIYLDTPVTGYYSTTPNTTLSGAQGTENFGYSVASGFEVNADQYQDVLVGAPYGNAGGMTSNGRVLLYLGGASGGVNTTPAWSNWGAMTGAKFGWSVAGGDINSDGYADVMVGAPGTTTMSGKYTNGGRAICWITETSTGLPGSTVGWAEGQCLNLQLGYSISFGPSLVNGLPNLIAGAPGNDSGCSPNVMTYYWQ